MLKTLPFGALRTLEAVVRLRGFSRAADELNVTQSAVSQHVRQLEDWLGTPLLVRRGRMAVPTEAGEMLAQATRESFGTLTEVCDALRAADRGAKDGILVAAPPGFAFLWLLPRLLRFAELRPDCAVSLSTDPLTQDRGAREADVIISYGPAPIPGQTGPALMGEEMTPVCAPALADELGDVDDLAEVVVLLDRLDDGSSRTNWDLWASGAGLAVPPFRQSRILGQANLVIQAAIDGHGVAMGRTPLVVDALAAGKLVQPFAQRVASPHQYWLAVPQAHTPDDPVTQFADWLRSEV